MFASPYFGRLEVGFRLASWISTCYKRKIPINRFRETCFYISQTLKYFDKFPMKNAWSFTQKLTQNLSQSIWSIQLDDLLNYGRWEDNSISRLSCVTQIWQIWYLEHFSALLCDTNMINMISRTFLYLGQFQWCDAFTLFLISYKNTIVLNYLFKKNVYTVWLIFCRINWAAIPPCGHTN